MTIDLGMGKRITASKETLNTLCCDYQDLGDYMMQIAETFDDEDKKKLWQKIAQFRWRDSRIIFNELENVGYYDDVK